MKKVLTESICKFFAYVSDDEIDRAEARELDYVHVVSHPREIGTPRTGEVIVYGIDCIAFGDRAAALASARIAANSGAVVGIHSYYADEPQLAELAEHDNVVVGKTHRHVLAALGIQMPVDQAGEAA